MANNLAAILVIATLYVPALIIERVMGWPGLVTIVGWGTLYLMLVGFCMKRDEQAKRDAVIQRRIDELSRELERFARENPLRGPPPPEDIGGVTWRGVG